MTTPRYKTPRDPRQSQLLNGFNSPHGIHPDAPAGGGGQGRFTSRKQVGNSSVIAFHSQTGPKDSRDPVWVSRLNQSYAKADTAAAADLWDVIEKAKALKRVYDAYELAKEKYVGPMILKETGQGLKEILEGLIPGLLAMLIVVAATTAIGGGIGAAIGALFGGVGAVPGGVVGAELGFKAGLFILNWLGIGFLVIYVLDHLGDVVTLMGEGVKRAWFAGKQGRDERDDVDQAAQEIAHAVAILVRLILEGIVQYLLAKGMSAIASRVSEVVGNLKKSRFGETFANWVERNFERMINDQRLNPKLREAQKSGPAPEAPKPSPQEPAKPARKEPNKEPKKEKPIRTAAQDRAAITKLSKESQALRKQGRVAEADAKLAEARNILEPHVKAKNWDAVVERLDVNSPKDKAVFWSGDKAAAQAYAEKIGGVTLETTPGGSVINDWNVPELNGRDSEALWGKVSAKYASGATGKVTAVQTPERYASGGGHFWKTYERPKLEERKKAGLVSDIQVMELK